MLTSWPGRGHNDTLSLGVSALQHAVRDRETNRPGRDSKVPLCCGATACFRDRIDVKAPLSRGVRYQKGVSCSFSSVSSTPLWMDPSELRLTASPPGRMGTSSSWLSFHVLAKLRKVAMGYACENSSQIKTLPYKRKGHFVGLQHEPNLTDLAPSPLCLKPARK